MMREKPTKRLHVSLEDELHDALAAEAAKRQTSKAAIIRQLIGEMFGNKDISDPMTALIATAGSRPTLGPRLKA